MKLKYTQNSAIYNYIRNPLSMTKMESEFKYDKQKRELFSHKSGASGVCPVSGTYGSRSSNNLAALSRSPCLEQALSMVRVKGLSTVQLLTP